MTRFRGADIKVNFGKSLLHAIQRNNFTVTRIAKELEINRSVIYQYVNEKIMPTLETAYRLALLLNFSLDDIEFESERDGEQSTNTLKDNLDFQESMGWSSGLEDKLIALCQNTKLASFTFANIMEDVFQAIFMKSNQWKDDPVIRDQAYPLMKLLVNALRSIEAAPVMEPAVLAAGEYVDGEIDLFGDLNELGKEPDESGELEMGSYLASLISDLKGK